MTNTAKIDLSAIFINAGVALAATVFVAPYAAAASFLVWLYL